MASTTTRLLTTEEFERMPEPEQPGKQELLDGELIQLPPAKNTHNNLVRALFLLLHHAIGTRARMEAGYQMPPNTWLVPDVSVTWPDQLVENDYFQASPMLAIEIVSPGNSADELDRKIVAYLNHGAAEVWILYPRTRTMMVHTPAKTERVTDVYTCETIPVVIKLSELL